MDNYTIKYNLREKINRFDEYILSKGNKHVADDEIKAYILENKLLNHYCKICQQSPIWNKKPLDLVLDRVNNNSKDNRIENLRLVCPNCLSQLKRRSTIFSKIVKVNVQKCIDCDKVIRNSSNFKNNKIQKFRCKQCIEKAIFFPLMKTTNSLKDNFNNSISNMINNKIMKTRINDEMCLSQSPPS